MEGLHKMNKIKENSEREERIENEIIVDAYNSYEKVTGWYCYLNDNIEFPFEAICIKEINKSPLKTNEKVTVLKTSEDENNLSGIYVIIKCNERSFEVPLEQLQPVNAKEQVKEAIEDWHYW
jgi:hypothetical protein